MEARLTVYFKYPFGVGVFEGIEDGKLSVCKVPFGAEPKDYEVWEYRSIYVKKEVVSYHFSRVKEITAVYPAYYENDGTLVLMEGDAMKDDGLPEKGKNYIFVGTAQPDGSIFLESLYAKTEFNDANYQKFINYVANETGVDRERYNSSFEIDSD